MPSFGSIADSVRAIVCVSVVTLFVDCEKESALFSWFVNKPTTTKEITTTTPIISKYSKVP